MEAISILRLLSIFDFKNNEQIAKNVSPAPIVSILFLLKAGQCIVTFFLRLIKIEPCIPLVTIIFSTLIFSIKLWLDLQLKNACLSLQILILLHLLLMY